MGAGTATDCAKSRQREGVAWQKDVFNRATLHLLGQGDYPLQVFNRCFWVNDGFTYSNTIISQAAEKIGLKLEFYLWIVPYAESWIQYGYDETTREYFKANRTTEGTYPPGSEWTKNPIANCAPYGGFYIRPENLPCPDVRCETLNLSQSMLVYHILFIPGLNVWACSTRACWTGIQCLPRRNVPSIIQVQYNGWGFGSSGLGGLLILCHKYI